MSQKKYDVIIIGSGFGGMLASVNLQKQGIDNFVLLERRAFMGGTWVQNSYPGAAVDVPSPLYSLSFEPYDWTEYYAGQSELNNYCEFIIAKYGLRERTHVNSNVTLIEWLPTDNVWQINTADGKTYLTQFIINATGPLSQAVIPDFKNLEKYQGRAFHSNDWDHDYDYTDKRLAIIGSGASAAQIIPEIAPKVKSLNVFQRTAHWVLPRHDMVFKPWQRKLLRKPWFYKLVRSSIYWAFEFRIIGFKYFKGILDLLGTLPAKKLMKQQIPDEALREKLTPDFTIGCKRILVSSTLYPAYSRENVTLHDKDNSILEFSEKGIITQDGIEHELDCVVFATGFDATDGLISYPVIGRNGQKLSDVWQDYPRAYLGTSIPHFPNLFIMTGPNTGIGHTSALFLMESQMNYILSCLKAVKRQKKQLIEVKPEAETRYTHWIHKAMQSTVWNQGGCTSWYHSKGGKVIAMFPGFSFTFYRWTRRMKPEDHFISDGEGA